MNQRSVSLFRRVSVFILVAAVATAGLGRTGRVGALAPSFTTLTASTMTVFAGQPISLTAQVTGGGPIPTGTVTFTANGVPLGTVALVGGVAVLNTPAFFNGFGNFGVVQNIVATYSGDLTYAPSSSNTVTLNIGGNLAVGVTISSSPNPSNSGQTVTFTATLGGLGFCGLGGIACGNGFCGFGGNCGGQFCGFNGAFCAPGFFNGGTMAFFDGAFTIGISSVIGGVATFSTSSLAPGTHVITAVWNGFSGNFFFTPNAGSALTQTVNGTAFGTVGATAITIVSGAGNPPSEGLTPGCNQVTLQSAPSTAIAVLAGLVTGNSTAAIWKFDNSLKYFIGGYFSTPGSPTDFSVTIGGIESYFFCVVQVSTITSR